MLRDMAICSISRSGNPLKINHGTAVRAVFEERHQASGLRPAGTDRRDGVQQW